jgi:hypothetical protein
MEMKGPNTLKTPKPLNPCLLGAYSGIGSRKTPKDILKLMEEIGATLAQLKLILRSGGAPGADSSFERGCDQKKGKKEIYLPWSQFNGNQSNLSEPTTGAFDIAKTIHPRWENCSLASKKLHARNIHQVLGKKLDSPSNFVIYWAEVKKGIIVGGTATAVNLAEKHNIPTYNLFKKDIQKQWENFVNYHSKKRNPQIT